MIEFTEKALENVDNCLLKIMHIRHQFGLESEEYQKASFSFIQAFEAVLGLGGKVTAEDDLSLYGVAFIHYGMIWHRNRSYPDGKDQPGEWSVHS